MSDQLFNQKTIDRLCKDVTLTKKQKESANEWLELLSQNKLADEKTNYPKFMSIVLQDILGYPIREIDFESNNVEFQFADSKGKKILCFEAKGIATKDLHAVQHRAKKEHETPIKQTWDYIGKIGLEYGICTNYKEFILITKQQGYSYEYKFDFSVIEKNQSKLKEFVGIFSKERIIDNGFIDKLYNESITEEREFTKEFYKLFHETRLMMIKVFEQKDNVTKLEAIYYTQLFLNRLIFIFFVEDRGFISDRNLFQKRILQILSSTQCTEHSKKIYDDIAELFIIFDKGSKILDISGFNGGLFSGTKIPDKIYFNDIKDSGFFNDVKQYSKLSHDTKLNKKASEIISKTASLNPIISNLLILDSFDFNSEVNVNILGHIFEQSITDLEELKNESSNITQLSKRKKEDVYYTPEYITDYICRNTIISYLSKTNISTVSELINEYKDNLEQLETKFQNIKILDPACGSGAFLIKAIDILLEINQEIQNRKDTKQKIDFISNNKVQTQITTQWNEDLEVRAIIENNIYGVDINRESIEITKLSLFLKLASNNRKLLSLSQNIKIGNSLIDDNTIDTNAFQWDKNFPEIFNPLIENHGFDVIIGNPPYVQLSFNENLSEDHKKFLLDKYGSSMGRLNTFGFFIKLGIELLKENGIQGFIVPNTLLTQDYYAELRSAILDTCIIESIVNFSSLPFKDAVVENTIPIIKKSTNKEKRNLNKIDILNSDKSMQFIKQKSIPQVYFTKNKNSIFNIQSDESSRQIRDKIEKKSFPLEKYLEVNQAIALRHSREKWVTRVGTAKNAKPLLEGGKNINRYSINWDENYLLYDLEGIHSCKTESIFLTKEKILFRRVANRLTATLDTNQFYGLHTLVVMNLKHDVDINLRYFLGLFNSRLMTYYYQKVFASTKTVFSEIGARQVKLLPIKFTSIKNQELIIEKVNCMLILNESLNGDKKKFSNRVLTNFNLKKLSKLKNFENLDFSQFHTQLKKQKIKLTLEQQDQWEVYFNKHKSSILHLQDEINQKDKEIDNMIYEIYGLNKTEIQIIENNIDSNNITNTKNNNSSSGYCSIAKNL